MHTPMRGHGRQVRGKIQSRGEGWLGNGHVIGGGDIIGGGEGNVVWGGGEDVVKEWGGGGGRCGGRGRGRVEERGGDVVKGGEGML